jgi:hypothetical protein
VVGRPIRSINVPRLVGIVYEKGGWRVGKNSKPFTMYVVEPDETIFQSAALKRFVDKGHALASDKNEADVVIGPRCWRIDPQLKLGDDVSVEESLERQLELMERGVRNIKYPKEKKDVTQ